MKSSSHTVEPKKAILLFHCEDKLGILANINRFLHENNGNILKLEQHVDSADQHFFMRVEWDLKGFKIHWKDIEHELGKFMKMHYPHSTWHLAYSNWVPKIALYVSKYEHCYYEILSRYESKEWDIEIPLIISNHNKLRTAAERLNIPYYHIPITKDNKEAQEHKQLELLRLHNIDLIVLARYMQILSDDFVSKYKNQIINIHHSFLPAFIGADPYRSAFQRGVKFIGATGHYVTPELDEGPIIAQDVISISHKDSIKAMKRRGRSIEKIVLAQAVWSHINNKVISYKNKTVVFD
jgi:formyltetrahydrofolate deformylase